ncbi:MAG TPA: hypothetical protein VGK74_19160 [Symbiobacteriaceae bacterium]
MSTEKASSAEARKLKLGRIKYYQKRYRGSNLSVDAGGYMAQASAMAGELIGDISEARLTSRKPVALEVYESQTQPGDLVGVPIMEATDDSLDITWADKGRRGKVGMGKLLTDRQTAIPEQSRMVIELYPDQDAALGNVVGMRMKGAQFLPKKKGKSRKKTDETKN